MSDVIISCYKIAIMRDVMSGIMSAVTISCVIMSVL